MVKINLLNIPEGQEVETTSRKRTETAPSDVAEFDFSQLEDTTFEETPPVERPRENVRTKEPEPFETPVFEEADMPPKTDSRARDFDDSVPKGLHYKILIGVGVLFLLVLAFFALKPLFTSAPQPPQTTVPRSGAGTTTGESGGVRKDAPAGSTNLPPALQTRYAGNTAANNFRLGLAEKILGTTSGNIQPALVVVTSGYAFISVVGDSRDAIAQYQKALKSGVPGGQLNVEGVEKKTIGGRSGFVADFSLKTGSIPGSGATVPARQIQIDDNLPAQLRSLAQRHRLTVRYLKKGDTERTGQFQQISYYLKLQGERSAVLNFVREMTQNHPAVNLSKLSLFATPGQTLSGRTSVNANLELLFYRPA